MGQNSHLSTVKFEINRPRHDKLHPQAADRRAKFAQNARPADVESSVDTIDKPYYKISIEVDKKGRIQTESSPAITRKERAYILKGVIPRFCRVLHRKGCGTPALSATEGHLDKASLYPSVIGGTDGEAPPSASTCTSSMARMPKQSNKRRRSSSEDAPASLPDEMSSHFTTRSGSIDVFGDQSHLVGIQIQDSEKLKEYLFDAFTSFQQINCRILCKSWIRTIEPKKQVKHPYNGNLKVKGVQKVVSSDLPVQKEPDPEETKPKWWPSKGECPHKEPDHIKKQQRLALLCHILMNTEDLHECSTEDLKKAIESDKAKIKPSEKVDILIDIWKIGYALERFRGGAIDGTSEVLVTARKEEARMIRGGGRSRKVAEAREGFDEDESSECSEDGQDVKQILSPTMPSTLPAPRYLDMCQTSSADLVRLDPSNVGETRPDRRLQPPQSRDKSCHRHADYDILNGPERHLDEIAAQRCSSSVLRREFFTEDDYGNLQAVDDLKDLFHADEQQILGQWSVSTSSDLIPIQYNGGPSQAPTINSPHGHPIFGHFSYSNSPKQTYRDDVHDYPVNSQSQPPTLYEDQLSHFQRVTNDSFPMTSTEGFRSANTTQHQSHDLPSHSRAQERVAFDPQNRGLVHSGLV